MQSIYTAKPKTETGFGFSKSIMACCPHANIRLIVTNDFIKKNIVDGIAQLPKKRVKRSHVICAHYLKILLEQKNSRSRQT